MVICRKCGSNEWEIFETEEESSNVICLKCVKCGNKESAFYKNGNIFTPKRGTIDRSGHSFKPLECTTTNCKSNRWRILQEGEIDCTACKEKFYLGARTGIKINISRETRPPKKVKDFYGKKLR